jgi:hypothetical protein
VEKSRNTTQRAVCDIRHRQTVGNTPCLIMALLRPQNRHAGCQTAREPARLPKSCSWVKDNSRRACTANPRASTECNQ